MVNLTSDEASLLQKLRQAKAAQDLITPLQRKPISHPEKYANPIGLDAGGRLFLQPGPAQADK
jgi:hypothetical protein